MEINRLLPNRFIAIGASASYPLKCWPMQNYHALISNLITSRWPVVLVGGANTEHKRTFSTGVNVEELKRRLEKERKKDKTKNILVATAAISAVAVSGLILSL